MDARHDDDQRLLLVADNAACLAIVARFLCTLQGIANARGLSEMQGIYPLFADRRECFEGKLLQFFKFLVANFSIRHRVG